MDFMIIHKESLVVFIRFLGNKYSTVNIVSHVTLAVSVASERHQMSNV